MRLIALGAILQFVAVTLGALGAHLLRARLALAGHVETWNTAVGYHALHALAVIVLGVWIASDSKIAAWHSVRLSAALFVAGIVCFSGSLYALSLGGPRWLGPVTPIGGVCFLAGWAVLGVFALRRPARHGKDPRSEP